MYPINLGTNQKTNSKSALRLLVNNPYMNLDTNRQEENPILPPAEGGIREKVSSGITILESPKIQFRSLEVTKCFILHLLQIKLYGT